MSDGAASPATSETAASNKVTNQATVDGLCNGQCVQTTTADKLTAEWIAISQMTSLWLVFGTVEFHQLRYCVQASEKRVLGLSFHVITALNWWQLYGLFEHVAASSLFVRVISRGLSSYKIVFVMASFQTVETRWPFNHFKMIVKFLDLCWAKTESDDALDSSHWGMVIEV